MQIVIEKNIPIPPATRNGRGRQLSDFTLALFSMEVGDSFVTERPNTKLSGFFVFARKKKGFRFCTRKVEGGTRVWRIA